MSSQVSNAPHPMADESSQELQQTSVKRKRNLPGTPDPDAEVIALSPKTLMATNRFLCEVCGKGFQRDQNLQLHRRGHNLPWKLKQRDGQEIKRRVYVCPEVSCVHHDPSRALGDLTGIKKHFSRKHGEKKWKCEKCSKRYAVQSDWKAHQKVCGTREYRCDCGTLFARRDSFVTHRAFCDALAQENVKVSVDAQVETPKIRPVIEATVIESSSSPVCQQATSEKPISEIFESPGRDTWEASSAFNECRTSAGQLGGQVMPPNKVVVCPGLSLSLGTGLGPGPPIMSEFMSGTLPQMIATSTSHQISKLAQVNSDWDTRSNRPFIYGGPSIFTSMFTPSSNSDSRNFGDSMAGLSIGINPSAENLIPQFGTQHNNAFFSASHQRQRGAQLPATTLLQKAAVMGVTKSSFLFRKPMDLSSSSTEEFHLRETWAGVTSSSASRHPTGASPSGDRLNSNYYDRYGVTGSSGFSPASYDGHDRTEASKDLSAGCSSSMASILHLGHNTEHERQGQCSLMNESHRQMSGSIARCPDLDETQREEASETNRMTLDFLGIGSQNSSFEKGVERANLVAAGVRPDQSSASKDTSHGNIEGCNR